MSSRQNKNKTLGLLIVLYLVGLLSNGFLIGAVPSDSVRIDVNQSRMPEGQQLAVYLPENPARPNHIPAPKIEKDPANGEFEVTFSSVNLTPNKQQQLTKSTDQAPLSILLFFLDNRKLKVVVKTAPFNFINGYYSIEKGIYIFDINYKNNAQRLATIQKSNIEEKKDNNLNNKFSAFSDNQQTEKEQSSNNIKTAGPQQENMGVSTIFMRAVKSALMVAAIIIFLVLATAFVIKIYSGQNILLPYLKEFINQVQTDRKVKEKPVQNRQKNIEPENIQPKKPASEPPAAESKTGEIEEDFAQEAAENFTGVNNKGSNIRKIMEKQGLTYDEAELYYNMNHSQFNA